MVTPVSGFPVRLLLTVPDMLPVTTWQPPAKIDSKTSTTRRYSKVLLRKDNPPQERLLHTIIFIESLKCNKILMRNITKILHNMKLDLLDRLSKGLIAVIAYWNPYDGTSL